ncbi:MAG TPA: ATP-binding protein [Candidatus Eisenbacteria bacterium]|nr:ATP-binding protein [Candidatus Eisenbacteria bacterium]
MISASERYLHERLAKVEARVRDVTARRRAVDPHPDDRFRGLYVSDADVDRLLQDPAGSLEAGPVADLGEQADGAEAAADAAEGQGEDVRLRRLARAFGLQPYDVELLLVAVAPDLDPRFERLYGYLNDDVTRRRCSVGLALELCGPARAGRDGSVVGMGAARARLGPAGALAGGGLLTVEDPDRPFLTRALRVPDRVVGHLLGDDNLDPAIASLLGRVQPIDLAESAEIERAIAVGSRLVYIRERIGSTALGLAAAGLRGLGHEPLLIDLSRLGAVDDLVTIARVAGREARLRGGGLIAGPVDAIVEHGPTAVRALAELQVPTVLFGSRGWDPLWSVDAPFLIDAPVLSVDQRSVVWRSVLDGSGTDDLADTVRQLPFRLSPEQMERAALAARIRATARGGQIAVHDVVIGARSQNAAGLERLARRVDPRVSWDDLVLPPAVLDLLRALAARARHRDLVHDVWGMGGSSARGRGITALFAGDSGTGKTISAEVIAGELGLDLYVIDLSTVVDKYIGETEKNLDRVFAEADRVNGVLLFDEADAIFGKRSEVKDARDRYANVEVAYLLQRMEQFEGMAILTTNLRANVDEAFLRRLDMIVDFPMPEAPDRERLWRNHLRPELPQVDDLDLEFMARSFRLAGGNIRNVAVGAAFLAAEAGRAVSMIDLVRETEREYRKLGRLVVEAEFGRYLRLLDGPAPAAAR